MSNPELELKNARLESVHKNLLSTPAKLTDTYVISAISLHLHRNQDFASFLGW